MEYTGNLDAGKPEHKVETQDIVRRHMQDPTHVITDEEMKSVTIVTDLPELNEHSIWQHSPHGK